MKNSVTYADVPINRVNFCLIIGSKYLVFELFKVISEIDL